MHVAIDRPADRLLVDRVELLSGWVRGGDGEFALTAACGPRPVVVRQCWHPDARGAVDLRGFWGFVVVQELLGEARDGVLTIDLAWNGTHIETLHLRLSPAAEHLAREYPLNLAAYPVPVAPGASEMHPHTLVFPGLGAVGGASLNALLRRKMLERDWPVPVYFEANDESLWRAARATGGPAPRWIDGHACYAAADELGVPFARVTLLRDPVRRLLSIFNYNTLVHPYEFPFATFEAFVHSDAAVRCTQAAALLRCAGIDSGGDPSAGDLYARARDELRHYALVGVTEAFEETIFLLCQLGGYDTIGMWWKVLSAPGGDAPSAFSAATRRRLADVLTADLQLYHEATRRLDELVGARGLGTALARYKRDAAERRELADVYKLLECLRWRLVLTDAELRILRGSQGR